MPKRRLLERFRGVLAGISFPRRVLIYIILFCGSDTVLVSPPERSHAQTQAAAVINSRGLFCRSAVHIPVSSAGVEWRLFLSVILPEICEICPSRAVSTPPFFLFFPPKMNGVSLQGSPSSVRLRAVGVCPHEGPTRCGVFTLHILLLIRWGFC